MKTHQNAINRLGASAHVVAAIAAFVLTFSSGFISAQGLSEPVKAQIAALNAEKAARTPAQKKLASKLIQLAREERGQQFAAGVTTLRPARASVTMNAQNLVEVDFTATVSAELLDAIKQAGGTIVNQFPVYNAIRAWVPPAAVEGLAERADIRQIRPADRAVTNVGTVTSQGDATHAADSARATFSVTGAGVKIGVLSDGVNSLAASKLSGDLSSSATVLPGQAGAGDEGTAMMEMCRTSRQARTSFSPRPSAGRRQWLRISSRFRWRAARSSWMT